MIGPDETYDIAHFEFIMRSAQRLMEKYPEQAAHISVSLHCELAEILNAYSKIVEREGKLTGLHAIVQRAHRIPRALRSGLHLIWRMKPIA